MSPAVSTLPPTESPEPGGALGRPRDRRIDDAVLEATTDLLEEVGYLRLTIGAVAERAGTTKPAVYRRWRTKSQLVREAVFPIRGRAEAIPPGGDLRSDIRALVTIGAELLGRPAARAALPGLMAEAAGGAAQAEVLARLGTGTWGWLELRIEAAIDAGEVRAGVEPATVLELIAGSTFVATATRPHHDLGADWVEGVVDIIVAGIAGVTVATGATPQVPLEVEPLVTAACERAGCDDFGGDSWREGLDVLVGALNTEASLNELGVGAMADQIVSNLVNRLQVERCYAEHPEIDEQQIVAPLFGLGLPRTGSTALSFLLAQDPARRSLRVWEASQPCPPPEAATEHRDARIATAQAGIDFTNEMFPGFAGMLPTAADGPQECLVPMAFEFRSLIFEGMSLIPTYRAWLLDCDMEPAYRYHRRVLKLLQWRCPPERWWLKSPAHILSIDALDAVYPDARFVMTHRDVGKVLPSVCALYDTLSRVLTERPDPVAIGTQSQAIWRTGLERLIDFRDRGNDHRFHDLPFEAVQRDPIGQVTRLYAELGDDLEALARRRMQDWWDESSTDRAGPGSYPPESFGLDPEVIAQEFAFYHQRFDVAVGPGAGDRST